MEERKALAAVTDQFTALSDQVYIWGSQDSGKSVGPTGHIDGPDVTMIFGWGDGQLNHLAKYTNGFNTIFPSSKIIVVRSPILRAMTHSLDQRVEAMKPVIEATFGPDHGTTAPEERPSVLIHVMSNTGGLNFAAALEAYRRLYNEPMPHSLLVFDSTPGSTDHDFPNMSRLADAMTIGTAAWFPWPTMVTKGLWLAFLYTLHGIEVLTGRESAPVWSIKAINDENFTTKQARRVYIYSKEDRLIWWEYIEKNAAQAVERGYRVQCTMFEGSDHVAHMRKWPEKYWETIADAWKNRND